MSEANVTTGIQRSGFGTSELERRAETAATSAAATARAMIESQYVMAMRNPRDWDEVRQRILKECDRTSFAREAVYLKPIGKGVSGLSIRFAEVAVRCMGNMAIPTTTTFDDAEKRIVCQSVVDLESNVHYSRDVTIEKTVERQQLREGQTALSRRMNSYGKLVYLIAASEDDLLNKEGALVSKALRTLVLRLLPGDIQAEARARVSKTMEKDVASDPEGQKKAILDAFFVLGVKPAEVKEYLGHDLEAMSATEVSALRGLHNAIKDGEATMKAAIDNAKEERGEKAPTESSATKTVGDAAKKAVETARASRGYVSEDPKPKTETKPPSTETTPPPVIAEAGGEAPNPPPAEKAQRGQPTKCKGPCGGKNKLTTAEKEFGLCSECRQAMTMKLREEHGTAPAEPQPITPLLATADPLPDEDIARIREFASKALGVFLKDNEDNILAANKALESLSGGQCKNFNALPLFIREHPEFERVVEEAIS